MPAKEQIESVVSRIEWLESMSYIREEGRIPEPVSDTTLPWWEDLDRAERQSVLDAEVDWGGFSEAEKLDVERWVLDGEDAESWMDGIAAGPTEKSGTRAVRPLTQQLIECCELDVWPSDATAMDFGTDSSSHLGALQFAIREGLVGPEELDAAMGKGDRLTEIARRGENPYRFVEFRTVWDEMPTEPGDEMPATEETGSLLREKADDAAQRPIHEKGVRYEDEYHRQLDEYASRPSRKGQDKEIER